MVDSGFDTARNSLEGETRLTPTLKFSQASKEIIQESRSANYVFLNILPDQGLALVTGDPNYIDQQKIEKHTDILMQSLKDLETSDPILTARQLQHILQDPTIPLTVEFAIAQKVETDDGIYLIVVQQNSGLSLIRDGELDNYIDDVDFKIKVSRPDEHPITVKGIKMQTGDSFILQAYSLQDYLWHDDVPLLEDYRKAHPDVDLAQALLEIKQEQYQKQIAGGGLGSRRNFRANIIGIECVNEERKVQTQPALVPRKPPVIRPTDTTRRPETTVAPEEENENTETIIRIFLEADKKPEERNVNIILDDLERLDLEKLGDKERKVMEKLGNLLLSEGRGSVPEEQIQTQLIHGRLMQAVSDPDNRDFERADKLLEIAELLGLSQDLITGKILTTVSSVLAKAKIANMHTEPTSMSEPASAIESTPVITPSPATTQPEGPPAQAAPANPGGLPDWLFLNESDTQQDISSILASGINLFATPGSTETAVTANPSSTSPETAPPISATETARPAAERVITPDVLKLRDDLTDVVEQINLGLDLTERDSISFEGTPQLLENYLKTLQINGAQVSEVRAFVDDNGFLDLSIGVIGETNTLRVKGRTDAVRFRGILDSDSNGRIILLNHILKGGFLTKELEGKIKKQIQNLNKTVAESLNKQLRPGWEVKGFRIKDGKIAIDFGKGSATVDVQSVELTRDQQVDIVFKYVRDEAKKRNVPIQTILDELKQ